MKWNKRSLADVWVRRNRPGDWRVVNLFDAGRSISYIAAVTRHSDSDVRRILKENGRELR
jgi:hypothetical protein